MSETLHLIDSHCHPPAQGKEPSADSWLERSRAAGVGEWIAVGTDPSDWHAHAALAREHPGTVHWTVGLHPSHVGERFEADMDVLRRILADPGEGPPPCALGEIGLDFTRLPKEGREQAVHRQRHAFAAQLEMARTADLPVVVHSRGTVAECLEILGASGVSPSRAVFHCFAEGPETLEAVRGAGARVSFTGIPTFRNAAEVREALRLSGFEDLMLETDSPYLSPEPFRGKPNEPARLRVIAEFCAELFGVTLQEVATVSTANVRTFFGISS